MADRLIIGFLGAGKMATALARGFVRAGLAAADGLVAADVSPAARESFVRETGAKTVEDNRGVLREAGVIIIAVKPAQVAGVLHEVQGQLRPDHLLISIAAGVPLARLEAAAPGARVLRVMPNTPAIVGAGASVFARGSRATAPDAELVQRLLGAVGLAFELPETLIDAATGLSGSGPAYAYLMIEALSDGGVAAGLPREVATQLAAQTLFGAAQTVRDTRMHPGALKDMVTSPGGTTIDGLHELEKAGVRAALMNAVRAAADKARRLGQG